MLLYVAQLAVFCGCVALGFGVKSADVHCSMTAVTVPLPVVAQPLDVPCDAQEREARPS